MKRVNNQIRNVNHKEFKMENIKLLSKVTINYNGGTVERASSSINKSTFRLKIDGYPSRARSRNWVTGTPALSLIPLSQCAKQASGKRTGCGAGSVTSQPSFIEFYSYKRNALLHDIQLRGFFMAFNFHLQ